MAVAALLVSVLFATPEVAAQPGVANADRLRSDVNGDGRDDIVTFHRGSSGDAFVATSTGSSFFGAGLNWGIDFAFADDLPLVGDFNGDGLHDILEFQRGSAGDSGFMPSNGQTFVEPRQLWSRGFVLGGQLPVVGDFNGDGRDDIVGFNRAGLGDVQVALSEGLRFVAAGYWHQNFAFRDEIPGVGNFDGDSRDDIVTFTRGGSGDVYVATSNGTAFFGTGVRWHDNFAYRDEIPQPTSVIGPIIW